MTSEQLIKLGGELRQSALDAHEGKLPSIDIAYSFLADNPECFSIAETWMDDLPVEAPIELIAAYYGHSNAEHRLIFF